MQFYNLRDVSLSKSYTYVGLFRIIWRSPGLFNDFDIFLTSKTYRNHKKNAGKCQIIRTNLVYLEMIYIYIHIITYTVIRQCSKKKFKIKKMKKRVYLPLKSPVTINRAPFLSCIEYMYNYCTPDRPSHTPIYDLYRYAMKTSLVSKMGRW